MWRATFGKSGAANRLSSKIGKSSPKHLPARERANRRRSQPPKPLGEAVGVVHSSLNWLFNAQPTRRSPGRPRHPIGFAGYAPAGAAADPELTLNSNHPTGQVSDD